MDISWVYSKLGMLIGLLVIMGVLFKVWEMYDIQMAKNECGELAKKIADTIGRSATISPQLIQSEGGLYKMKLELPNKLHGAFYEIKLDFNGVVEVKYPQAYRGEKISCMAVLPTGAIPDYELDEYLVVNNMYMVGGNETERYDDDIYVWPKPKEEVQTPKPVPSLEENKEIEIEFISQADWVAFNISSGDTLTSPSPSLTEKDGIKWDYVHVFYSYPPCQSGDKTHKVTINVKDNGDDKVKIKVGEGAGCSKNKAGDDIMNIYFNNNIEMKKLISGRIGCKSGYDSCDGFKEYDIQPLTYLAFSYNKELKALTGIEVGKTTDGLVITLDGIE